jgi:hypothetical protein
LAEIHRGIQAMKYSPMIPREEVEQHGLSGVLVGPEGDDDAEMVRDVIFANDPSKKHGLRHPGDSDQHAVRIAELNDWTEVHEDGSEIVAGEEHVGLGGIVRIIFGRNKDQYVGKSVFTLAQARGMLRSDLPVSMIGGYLFSGRPFEDPYGELAAVVRMDAAQYEPEDKYEFFRLGFALERQHRFNMEAPWGTEVFEINPKYAAK